jgi:hypothetical protein
VATDIACALQTRRTLVKDDVVPLSKPYPRSDGKGSFSYVELKKGQDVCVPCALRMPLVHLLTACLCAV